MRTPGSRPGSTATAGCPSIRHRGAAACPPGTRSPRRGSTSRRRGGRYLTRDPRRLAAAGRRELADFLADQGVGIPASATVAELASAVDEELAVDARSLVEALDAARFGPPQAAGAEARRARRELRRVEHELRNRLSRFERARGLLSLRSLGFGT